MACVTLEPWREGPIPDDVQDRAHAAVRGRSRLPRVGDGQTQRVDLLESFAELVAVSMARAQFLGELLAEQIEAASTPTEGLVAETLTVSVVGNGPSAELEATPTGEEIRALVKLEAEERDRAAKLIEKALKIGVTLQQVEMLRSYGTTIAAALQTFVIEVGLSLDDEPVLRAAQRAGLAARRSMGTDDGDPDRLVGPRMAPSERVSALRQALQAAETDADRMREVAR